MSQKLSVLISAYACEPNKGSEPEVGWQLALHMAKYHDVSVLTRANNQPVIERALADYSEPRPNFIYYDLPQWIVALKKRWLGIAVYYFLWQLGARLFMRQRLRNFDLIHHATFNSFRHPGFWWFGPAPVVLGPLGGGQICPWRFLPWFRKQVINEILRSLSVVNSYIFPHIYLSFHFADKILVANEDTARCVPWLFQHKVQRLLETAVTPGQIIDGKPAKDWSGIRLLWISRLDKLKGGELAIRAFADAVKKLPGLTLTLVGGGREERPLKRLTKTLGLDKSVIWQGRVPKTEMTDFIQQHDAFIFTSLRDTSGNVVLEAMAAGLPVIAFRHHGVAEITTDETALRVPITKRRQTVTELGQAMVTLAQSAELRERLGRAGRDRVRAHYLWAEHVRQMDAVYRRVCEEKQMKAALKQKTLRMILVPKGILLAAAILFLVGATGFFTVGHLKHSAHVIVRDTLPGLSCAASANLNLAQSFNRTLLMVISQDAGQQAAYAREMKRFSQQTTDDLANYERAIFDEGDRKLFQQMIERRTEYIAIRERILGLLEENRPAEALALCKESLLPAYDRYREAGSALLNYNVRQGQSRGESIMGICTVTQLLVAVVGVALFVGGFIIGFFK